MLRKIRQAMASLISVSLCVCARRRALSSRNFIFVQSSWARSRVTHVAKNYKNNFILSSKNSNIFSSIKNSPPSKHTPLWIAYDFLRMRKANFSRNGLRVRCGDDDEYWAFSFPHFHYKRTHLKAGCVRYIFPTHTHTNFIPHPLYCECRVPPLWKSIFLPAGYFVVVGGHQQGV